jgi:hypothetical protein
MRYWHHQLCEIYPSKGEPLGKVHAIFWPPNMAYSNTGPNDASRFLWLSQEPDLRPHCPGRPIMSEEKRYWQLKTSEILYHQNPYYGGITNKTLNFFGLQTWHNIGPKDATRFLTWGWKLRETCRPRCTTGITHFSQLHFS